MASAALEEYTQLEPREICSLCQILRPRLAGAGTLGRSGFHTTQQMPTDQRRVLVRLATKGDQLINRMASLIELQYQLIE